MHKDYGLTNKEWSEIKEDVIAKELKSNTTMRKYNLDDKQIWFLYDRLLQEKYNHLYKRSKLINPKMGDYVYCDYDGFGRGIVKGFSKDESLMIVKFDKRPLKTMCDCKLMITVHDDIKRKITRL